MSRISSGTIGEYFTTEGGVSDEARELLPKVYHRQLLEARQTSELRSTWEAGMPMLREADQLD